MCGIAGIIRYHGEADEQTIRDMNDRMTRRGPDDSGVFVKGRVALSHRRLSIIDIKTGHQPLTIDNGNIVIVYNGEIYNFQELREELAAQGATFYTNSDTEVVAQAYLHYGIRACLEKLEGMYAFAIYDQRSDEVHIARDSFGEKPLYYIQDEDGYRFASELKAFNPREQHFSIDKTALNLFLSLDYIPAPYSIYEPVRKMMPGTWTTIGSDHTPTTHTYYRLQETIQPQDITEEEAKARLRELLTDSVKKRMVADVPAGAFLSGGIDSSIICCLMNQLSDEPIRTFSIGFNERECDETHRAELLARHIGSKHTKYILEYKDVIHDLDELLAYYDEPFGDSSAIPSYYVSKLARKDVKFVLTGDCADELFAGYEKYLADYYSRRYKRVPKVLRMAFEKMVDCCPINGYTNNLLRKVKKIIRSSQKSGFGLYYDMLCLGFNDDQRKTLLKPEMYQDIKPLYEKRYDAISDRFSYLQKQQLLDVESVLEGCMFPKVDRACMYNSLENRAPFIDSRILELALSMPDGLKQHGRNKKYILKETFKDLLPEATIHFSKKGFDVPVDHWLREDLREDLERLTGKEHIERQGLFDYDFIQHVLHEHFTGKENHKNKLWNLYVFQKWYEQIYG